jgi:hypothetical protein
MPTAYRNNGYRFTSVEFTLADFSTRTNLEVGPDEFTTVEELDVEKGEGVVVGQGQSSNLLQAEGSISGDIQDTVPADIDGRYRLVALNSQNNVLDIIAEGTINQIETTRTNNIDGDITPFTGKEIYEPYKLGFQLKTNSGTQTYSNGNSNLSIDGYRGEKVR